MKHYQEDSFYFSYEGTRISIQKDQEDQYIFHASISLDASKMSQKGESILCTRETLEKAVALIKQKNFDGLKEQIAFDPCWQEWRAGLPYPYFGLSYSFDGETYNLRTDYDDYWANVSVYSPAFPAVMTLLHELAVLFETTKQKSLSARTAVQTGMTSLYKVLCPHCEKAIRPRSNYCSECGKPLIGISELILSEETIDLDETIHLCRHCGKDVSWHDVYCRWCGGKLWG